MNVFVLCQCTVGGGRGGGGGRSARKLSDGNSLAQARGSDGFDLPCPVLWRRRRKHFEGCREGRRPTVWQCLRQQRRRAERARLQ